MWRKTATRLPYGAGQGRKFVKTDEDLFSTSDSCEDVDAVFDANKDGFPDLYVVSGGTNMLMEINI